MFGLRRIRQAMHRGIPPQRGEGDHAVVQRRAAAEEQIPAVGIGARQMPIEVRVQVHAPLADSPLPRLRVVDRRCPHGESQRRMDRLGIREVRIHGGPF